MSGDESDPAFEVATVKPSGPEITTRRFFIEGRRFVTLHTSLADLIQFAYGLHARQLATGPAWLESRKFDVVGTTSIDRPPTEQEWMKMMGNLLNTRFHLGFHLEKRELPVYGIVVDRDGPKFKATDKGPDSLPSMGFQGRGRLVAHNAKLSDLAWELESAVLARPVVDQTGLTSRFDFTLTWLPDEFQTGALVGETNTGSEAPPNLLTALRQQLGLRLIAVKSFVDVMVIEHVDLPERD
jgi:uncharacterized protein (TIGR03435 family)